MIRFSKSLNIKFQQNSFEDARSRYMRIVGTAMARLVLANFCSDALFPPSARPLSHFTHFKLSRGEVTSD
jgi:hypothetical protein